MAKSILSPHPAPRPSRPALGPDVNSPTGASMGTGGIPNHCGREDGAADVLGRRTALFHGLSKAIKVKAGKPLLPELEQLDQSYNLLLSPQQTS